MKNFFRAIWKYGFATPWGVPPMDEAEFKALAAKRQRPQLRVIQGGKK